MRALRNLLPSMRPIDWNLHKMSE